MNVRMDTKAQDCCNGITDRAIAYTLRRAAAARPAATTTRGIGAAACNRRRVANGAQRRGIAETVGERNGPLGAGRSVNLDAIT
jgi:hypothetical protein